MDEVPILLPTPFPLHKHVTYVYQTVEYYIRAIKKSNLGTGGHFNKRKDSQSNISTYCCWFITNKRHYFFYFWSHSFKWLFNIYNNGSFHLTLPKCKSIWVTDETCIHVHFMIVCMEYKRYLVHKSKSL